MTVHYDAWPTSRSSYYVVELTPLHEPAAPRLTPPVGGIEYLPHPVVPVVKVRGPIWVPMTVAGHRRQAAMNAQLCRVGYATTLFPLKG
jgi:hypothetical protein